ncbi:hypothetical protein ACHQM5_007112 [Ranunculus cassubicifolius]
MTTPRDESMFSSSQFDLLPKVENLANVIENKTPDPENVAQIKELAEEFNKCEQLLKSISGSMGTKTIRVEEEKCKLDEAERRLIQREGMIADFRRSANELIKTED